MTDLPLSGVRVLDLTRILAGPFCSALLADLGAEVIKVETPAGDDYRHIPPFSNGQGGLFLLLNRGKESVVLDMKTDEGRRIARDLALSSDVLLENFRPGVMSRLGLNYDALAAENPRLIHAAISGFGQQSPMRDLPAYDLIIQAITGLMDVTGEPEGAPTMIGESVADLTAGLFGSWAILAALIAREKTGRGQQLDIAMFDCLFNFLPASLTQYLYGSGAPRRVGNRHPLGAPFGVFAAADGHYTIAVLNAAQFARLAAAMERPSLADDPRFASNSARIENHEPLRAEIEDWSAARSVADVVTLLKSHDVPASRILSVAEAAKSDQVRERGLLQKLGPASGGEATVLRQPVKFSRALAQPAKPPPALGQHTEAVLSRVLGLDAEALAKLAAGGVIPSS